MTDDVVAHRMAWLTEPDLTRLGAIPITTVPASIVSAAGALGRDQIEEAIVEGQRRWRRIMAALAALVERVPANLAGLGDVRRALQRFDPERAAALLSRLEAKGLVFVRGLGLPEPSVNRRLFGPDGELIAKVDFDWAPPRITLEWDGLRYHSTPRQKRHDDARQNAVVLSGRLVLRYGWADLRDDPERIAADLRRAFALRGHPVG